MSKKKLQLISGQIVVESKLTKPAKFQLLNWLKSEATEGQIKAFLLDGGIVKLDKQSEDIVNARFESSKIFQEIKDKVEKTKK